MDVTVIRPLIYVEESDVIGFVNKYNLPVVKSPCPADGNTKREYVHQLLQQLNQEHHGVKNRMFTAICTGEINGFKEASTALSFIIPAITKSFLSLLKHSFTAS